MAEHPNFHPFSEIQLQLPSWIAAGSYRSGKKPSQLVLLWAALLVGGSGSWRSIGLFLAVFLLSCCCFSFTLSVTSFSDTLDRRSHFPVITVSLLRPPTPTTFSLSLKQPRKLFHLNLPLSTQTPIFTISHNCSSKQSKKSGLVTNLKRVSRPNTHSSSQLIKKCQKGCSTCHPSWNQMLDWECCRKGKVSKSGLNFRGVTIYNF